MAVVETSSEVSQGIKGIPRVGFRGGGSQASGCRGWGTGRGGMWGSRGGRPCAAQWDSKRVTDFCREETWAQREAMEVLRRSTSGAGTGGWDGVKRGVACEKKGEAGAFSLPLSRGGSRKITSSSLELREVRPESKVLVRSSIFPWRVVISSSKVEIEESF